MHHLHFTYKDIKNINYSPKHQINDIFIQNSFIFINSVYKFCIVDSAQLNLIHEAMKDYQKYTCIRLKPRTNENDYVVITSDNTGCHSYIGRIGGRQVLNLQIPGCVTKKGTAIHEIMHATGFWHEHTRPDRDSYVTINTKNIIPSTLCKIVLTMEAVIIN